MSVKLFKYYRLNVSLQTQNYKQKAAAPNGTTALIIYCILICYLSNVFKATQSETLIYQLSVFYI